MAAANMTTGATKEISTSEKPTGLSAKELALYVGVPVATICVAGGIYYYYSKKSSGDTKKDKQTDNKTGTHLADMPPVINKPTDSEDGVKTPLEIAQAAKAKGNKYFKATKYNMAIECYTTAIENCPKENAADIATFYQNRAAAYEQLKNWENVVNDSSEAIKLNPKYTKALSRRARGYEVLDEKRKCLEDVTAVCLLEGFQNQQCMILADRILKAIGKELAENHFKTRPKILPSPVFVKSYLDSFNSDVFHEEIEETIENTTYRDILNKMKANQYEELMELATTEIDKDGPYKRQCYLLRATLYTLMCDIERAMSDFNIVMELEDDDVTKRLKVDALIKRGSLKMQLEQDKECYKDFDEAIQIDDQNPNIYHHRGQLYFLTERLRDAQKDFEKSISLDSKFIAPRLQLGYCLCKIAMQMMQPSLLEEANKILEETTELFPKSPEAWSLYGQLLQDQQQLDKASEKLEKAISLAPNNPTTYVYKALLTLQWKQDLTEANKLIRKAIEIDEKCDFAYETLATLEVQKGNNEEAIQLFEKALDLVRTESEMANTFSLLEAAKAQSKITKQYGITVPTMQPGMM